MADARDEPPGPRLTYLPLAVLARVCDHLSRRQLPTVRLVCRDMRAAAGMG